MTTRMTSPATSCTAPHVSSRVVLNRCLPSCPGLHTTTLSMKKIKKIARRKIIEDTLEIPALHCFFKLKKSNKLSTENSIFNYLVFLLHAFFPVQYIENRLSNRFCADLMLRRQAVLSTVQEKVPLASTYMKQIRFSGVIS